MMRTNKLQEVLIFGSLLTTTVAFAYAADAGLGLEPEKPYYNEFRTLNKDGDQTLDWTEIKAGDKNVLKKDFLAFDHDHDGTLNYDEFTELKVKEGKQAIKGLASDSWITSKAKAKLLEEESLKSLEISVETHKGEVLLSGFVSDPTLKAKAAAAVAGIEGVKSVKNAIVVKG